MALKSGVRRRRHPRKGEQLSIFARLHGGARRGAGRPKRADSGVPHLRRPTLSRHHPVHVTWRVLPGVPFLRRRRIRLAIERVLGVARARLGVRVVHYSVQANHLHFIVEAQNEAALSRGLQGLAIRLAKAINKAFGRRGRLFADRYHSRVLKSPRETRGTIRYVLHNGPKHALERGELTPEGALDTYSSARFFSGYADRDPMLVERAWRATPTPPVCRPQCWLLKTGRKRTGLLRTNELPST